LGNEAIFPLVRVLTTQTREWIKPNQTFIPLLYLYKLVLPKDMSFKMSE